MTTLTYDQIKALSDNLDIHSALQDFIEDSTEDAAITVIERILRAVTPLLNGDRKEALGDVLAMMAVHATPEELANYVADEYSICLNPLSEPLAIEHDGGGQYRYLGEAVGAGKSKGMANVRVYRTFDGKHFYFRHDPNDFFTRFKAVK